MDNQHQRIAGYRDLTQEEIDLMNVAKQLEATFNSLIDQLKTTADIDQRQVAIAQTDGESAFMRVVRSIARPARLTTVREG